MPLGTHQTGGRQRVPSRPRPRGSSIGRQTARIEPIISKAGRPSHDPRESRLIESRFEGLLARSTQPLHVSYHRQHPIMTSPTLHRLLLLPFLGSLEISCQTTVEEEYADFNPIIRSQSESQESKVMRMFGEYDLEKKSEFQGRAYEFEGREANLRKSVKKEAYSFGDHPYFKFRKKAPFSNEDVFRTQSAREGAMASRWQDEENSWFKRLFSRKEARLNGSELPRKSFTSPQAPRSLSARSHYEKRDYPIQIVDDPQQDKKISREGLRSLLNAR